MNALEGIREAELDFSHAPGKWTSREIVHHLADSEMTSAIRFRRLLAENQPEIQGYDQDEYARRLFCKDRPLGPALMALQASIDTTAQLFERMSDEDWRRSGRHSKFGEYSAERWLEIYSAHAAKHADQIRRNRAAFRDSR
jgi:hypothetical protein